MLADSLTEGSVQFKMETFGYFRNTEYLAPLVDGQTWPGVRLQPVLVYAPVSRGHIYAGVQLDQRAGAKPFGDIQPILRIEYAFSADARLVLGTLYGHAQHLLPEPAFSPERFLTRPLEQGLQFLHKKKHVDSELFIDWQQYIVPNDTLQEKFTAGIVQQWSTNFFKKKQLTLPWHFLLHHRGGQINQNLRPIQSVINFGIGPGITFVPLDKHKLTVSCWALYHKNLTPSNKLFYNTGWALQPRVRYETPHWQLDAGFWRSKGYIAPVGETVYAQVSTRGEWFGLSQRSMLFSKVAWHKQLDKNFGIAAAFEQYIDVRRGKYEYAYSVYLKHSGLFLIKKRLMQTMY